MWILFLAFALTVSVNAVLAQTAVEGLRAGMAATARGDDRTAVRHYGHAINTGDLSPKEAALAHFNRGNAFAFSRSGFPELALADFDAATRLQPDDAEAQDGRGNALVQLGQYENAIRCFAAAVALAPDNPRIRYNRGNAYARLGRKTAALDDYNVALRHRPDYVAVLYTVAACTAISARTTKPSPT